jgi:hypothetical protein
VEPTEGAEHSFNRSTNQSSVVVEGKQKQSVGRTSLKQQQQTQQKVLSDKEEVEKSVRNIDKSSVVNSSGKKTIVSEVNTNSGNSNNQYKKNNSSLNKNRDDSSSPSRKLRSQGKSNTANSSNNKKEEEAFEGKHNLRRKATTAASTSVVPKKRQRISDKFNSSEGNSGNNSPTRNSLNLGARLAKGREPAQNFANQDLLIEPSTSSQQSAGHPPTQNLLRRSSRGKSSTTGSCVSNQELQATKI